MSFRPGTQVVAEMAELRDLVRVCLGRLSRGELPTEVECEQIDIKEEAGRRGTGGTLLDGERRSTRAADQLADETACMANTAGGGALIVGVEDRTGDLLGTNLDVDWLRNEIYRRVDVAPVVEEHRERGIRLLTLLVPEAREPVEDTGGRVRWRVGQHCTPVDRAQWWHHREDRIGRDGMVARTQMTVSDVAPGALAAARRYVRSRPGGDADGLGEAPASDFLRRIGVLDPDGRLNQAGALLFCAASSPWLAWTRLDVVGGEVLAAQDDFGGLSLLEQIARVEDLVEAANDRVTLPGSFSEAIVRLLPPRAAREAVLNGVVHRDWNQPDPTTVTWVEADSSLEVVSPGEFTGGITEDNLLTQRYARHPALADAARALGLVERQGLGVDRMFRDMIALGHRKPVIAEQPGPRIRVRLSGGQPVVPVMRLVDQIEPVARRADVRIALIVHRLLHHGFTTATSIAPVLQRTVDEASEALETAAECVVRGEPLIVSYRDVWLLSEASKKIVLGSGNRDELLRRLGVLAYLTPDPEEADLLVRRWLETHNRISSGDYSTVTGLTYAGARRALERLATAGLLVRGAAAGRNAHFLPGPAF